LEILHFYQYNILKQEIFRKIEFEQFFFCNIIKIMKKIEAIIRKSKFDEVVKALHDAEVYFFSYWDVTGVGNEKMGKV
jgi:hypothetical protein